MTAIYFNAEAERAVLGAILRDPGLYWIHRSRITPALFANPFHRKLAEEIDKLAAEDRAFGVPELTGRVVAPDGASTAAHLMMLKVDQAADSNSFPDLIDDLRELWARRAGKALGERLIKESATAELAAQDWLEKAMLGAQDIGSAIDSIDLLASARAIDRVLGRMESTEEEMRALSVPWFLPEITHVVGDIEYGWLTGLLSDSMAGKTSLALQQAYYAASQGIPVLFLSGDQREDDCWLQLVSQELRIESQRLRWNKVAHEDRRLVKMTLEAFKTLPIHFIEIDAPTIRQVARWIQDFVRRVGRSALVIIDHEDILEANHPRDDLHEKVRQIDRDLKSTIRRLRCACILIMQRNAKASQRESPRPIDMDLVGGPRRKKSFDSLMYVYREYLWITQQIKIARDRLKSDRDAIAEMQAKADRVERQAEIGAMKFRFGKPRTALIGFEGSFTRYFSEEEDRIAVSPRLVW